MSRAKTTTKQEIARLARQFWPEAGGQASQIAFERQQDRLVNEIMGTLQERGWLNPREARGDWQDLAVMAGWVSGEAAERLAEQVRYLKRRLDQVKASAEVERQTAYDAGRQAGKEAAWGEAYQEGLTDAYNDVAGG